MVGSSSSNLPFAQTFASSAIAACTAEVRHAPNGLRVGDSTLDGMSPLSWLFLVALDPFLAPGTPMHVAFSRFYRIYRDIRRDRLPSGAISSPNHTNPL